MRDPYDLLGITKDADFETIRAAYRKACKRAHPDMGGSHEQMLELQTAYAFILTELKKQKSGTHQKSSTSDQAKSSQSSKAGAGASKRQQAPNPEDRDIEDELNELHKASSRYEEQLRAKRDQAWSQGNHAKWAKLSWDDFFGFLTRIARSGLKGVSLLVVALMGLGAVLLELNIVSAILIGASLLGFAVSVAYKSDKGGLMSAVLVLFGLLSLWAPPIRMELLAHPLAAISLLICLGLILKFVKEGGKAGAFTGGALVLYLVFVILQTEKAREVPVPPAPQVAQVKPKVPVVPSPQKEPVQKPAEVAEPPKPQPVQQDPPKIVEPAPKQTEPPPAVLPQPQKASDPPFAVPAVTPQQPPEERTLIASDGARLNLVQGVNYHLKLRTGHVTHIHAESGQVKIHTSGQSESTCVNEFEMKPDSNATGTFWSPSEVFIACKDDALLIVSLQ